MNDIKISDAITIENFDETNDGKRNLLSFLFMCENLKNEYVVELRVVERDSELVHINLLVTSAAAADAICSRWKECSTDVYGYLISTLTAGNPPAGK